METGDRSLSYDTFIITIFRDSRRSAESRGRVRHVASGMEYTFLDLDELAQLLRDPVDGTEHDKWKVNSV